MALITVGAPTEYVRRYGDTMSGQLVLADMAQALKLRRTGQEDWYLEVWNLGNNLRILRGAGPDPAAHFTLYGDLYAQVRAAYQLLTKTNPKRVDALAVDIVLANASYGSTNFTFANAFATAPICAAIINTKVNRDMITVLSAITTTGGTAYIRARSDAETDTGTYVVGILACGW